MGPPLAPPTAAAASVAGTALEVPGEWLPPSFESTEVTGAAEAASFREKPDRATAEASRQIVLWTDQQGFQACELIGRKPE